MLRYPNNNHLKVRIDMLKKLVLFSLAVLMVLAMNTTAFAASPKHDHSHDHEHVSVGDLIHTETGIDVVFRVNEDQSYYTKPLNRSFINPRDCSHTNLQPYGNTLGSKQSYNKKNPTYCYWVKTLQYARCLDCRTVGIRIYGRGEEYKHSYPLFGNECKRCGYKR